MRIRMKGRKGEATVGGYLLFELFMGCSHVFVCWASGAKNEPMASHTNMVMEAMRLHELPDLEVQMIRARKHILTVLEIQKPTQSPCPMT